MFRVAGAAAHPDAEPPRAPGTAPSWATPALADPRAPAGAITAPGATGVEFRAAWAGKILPALDAFAPELIIVSAGFDAHKADPLAQLRVETADFGWLTAELLTVARKHCGGRLVSLLEGGYDLQALAACAAAHVRALMNE